MRPFRKWRDQVNRKLAPVRMGNATAVASANHGAWTRLAREIRVSENGFGCTVVALRVAGKDNAATDALFRFTIKASGGDPFQDR